jgi:serine/threonine-protein kinase
MNPDRWAEVERLYHGASARPAGEREAFLREACAGDESLRREVESLLAQPGSGEGFLGAPAMAVAAQMVSHPGGSMLTGRRIGVYQIQTLLGAGGMGEVYRARDARLRRDVALKILPCDFIADSERLARFEREARVLASLNHPHIATLYGLEEAGDVRALVLELIEGPTLAERLTAGPLPVPEALAIARDLTEALEAAHERGIVHRDLKPANIKVTRDGIAKVLDFGLAKAAVGDKAGPDLSHIPTTTIAGTRQGIILGTAAYMSPEQARGQAVDKRTDIWAFGCVLFEMLSGRATFSGETISDIIVAVLEREPVWDRLPGATPPGVHRLLHRCLDKDPRRRLRDIGDARIELEEALELKAQRRAWESGPAAPHIAPRPVERVASIAVLPLTDMSAAKDQDWFCDGIAEEILNALIPLQGLRVAARTSAFSFKGKSDDLRTIGEKLKVTTVLEGSVRRAGDRVRITVRLSDVANGFQLWSERYDRELKEIFDVQDEIAKAIAERLRVTLAGGKDERLVEQATTNVEAYQLFLKGHALLGRRGASIPAALDLFRKAVEIDPGYSLAWAGIADACTGLAITGSVGVADSKPQAMAAATRSIELDAMSAAGHTALACATLLFENNRDRAKREFERALELRPSYVLGRSWYALFYLQWARGKFEQGIAEARRALDIDPLSAYATFLLGLCLCTAGHMDEAIETGRRAVQQDPDSFVARWGLGISLGTAGRFEEAISTLKGAAGMSGRHSRALTSLAAVFGQWGKPSEASALHRELMDRASRAYVPLTYLTLTSEAAGQLEEALAFARRAWDEREPTFILHARHFPEFRTLHPDPRFASILGEMNEPS